MAHMQFAKAVHKVGVDVKKVKYVSSQDGAGMTMLLGDQKMSFLLGLVRQWNKLGLEMYGSWYCFTGKINWRHCF